MDIRKVKKLIELLEGSEMSEIEIKEAEGSIRIVRGNNFVATKMTPVPVVTTVQKNDAIKETTGITKGHPITSPMVGTFYAAASSASKNFITVGQHVNQGDTVCIIEAMKIMNQIKADQSGTVVQILCSDGEAIEFGQVLAIIQ